MAQFDRAELDEMVQRWIDENKRCEAMGDWKPLAEMYTVDATYGWNYGPKQDFMAVGRD
ncbi:MAG: nuclear transport factor 2 family protein, partial [Mycobacteriaceae bacterium]